MTATLTDDVADSLLARHRRWVGMTQTRAAYRARLRLSRLIELEDGRSDRPTACELHALARTYATTIGALTGVVEPPWARVL